ncbi:hypothetical protein [Parabacteroides sp.]
MKKNQFKEELPEAVSKKATDPVEEFLNLDELLEIQGGIDNDEDLVNCGLGCFLGGIY